MNQAAESLLSTLKSRGDPRQAARASRFFKTMEGQYGHGDVFVGVTLPVLRVLAKDNPDVPVTEAVRLLYSEIHEARLLALLIMVNRFRQGDAGVKRVVAGAYLENTRQVNNWDLVDSSAHMILGPWLENRSRRKLDALALSKNLWERRIAIIATFHFIRLRQFDDTLRIADRLLGDSEDLIHKAVGWMLREVGNRDRDIEEAFLANHYRKMPRTMLRYAIEKFPEARRQGYLKGTI